MVCIYKIVIHIFFVVFLLCFCCDSIVLLFVFFLFLFLLLGWLVASNTASQLIPFSCFGEIFRYNYGLCKQIVVFCVFFVVFLL